MNRFSVVIVLQAFTCEVEDIVIAMVYLHMKTIQEKKINNIYIVS